MFYSFLTVLVTGTKNRTVQNRVEIAQRPLGNVLRITPGPMVEQTVLLHSNETLSQLRPITKILLVQPGEPYFSAKC